MPSLREMMAKKAAAQNGAAAQPEPKPKPAGTVIRADDEPPGKVRPEGPIKEMIEEPPATTGRQLDQTTNDGEQVPMDWPSDNCSLDEKLWWQARHCLDRKLVIWIEPTAEGAERAWLAVKHPSGGPLILITALPLASNPGAGMPF
jgi:hypothetical protein